MSAVTNCQYQSIYLLLHKGKNFLYVTWTVFSCWACNVVTWLLALATTGFSSVLPPIVTTLNCGAWILPSPDAGVTPGLLPVWGNWSTIGCPGFPIAVTKSFCPSCLMTWGWFTADFAASVAWDEATLLRIIWWFAGEMVKGAVSFCKPLVVTLVPVTLSVVLVVAVDVAMDDLRARCGDDVLEIVMGSALPKLMLSLESVVVEVVRFWVLSAEEPEPWLKFSEAMGESVSMGTNVSPLGSDWIAVLSHWEWQMSSVASVSMISSGRRLLSSGETSMFAAHPKFQLSVYPPKKEYNDF